MDRIPAVLSQDVTVHVASGIYMEHALLADRLAQQGHAIRLIGEPQATIRLDPSFQRTGVVIRRSATVVLENLIIKDFANGVHVRLSDAVINNIRIEENAQNGILCERGRVTLQAAAAGPGVTIQNNASGSGIEATCGCHVQFEGPAWIGQNGTGLTAMFAAVIDLNGRSDVTLANAVVTPPPASEPEPPTSPPGTRPPDGPPMILSDVEGYANAQIVGVCACAAKDLSLCHPATD